MASDQPADRRLLGRRIIPAFLARFVIVFGLLMAPWPGVFRAYAPAYRATGNLLFGSFGTQGTVQLRDAARRDPHHDTELVLRNWQTDAEKVYAGSSMKAYEPTAFLTALILATPIPWRRRWRAAAWGLGIVCVYAALRTGVFLLFAFSGNDDLAVFSPGPLGRSVISFLYWVLGESYAGSLIVPLPIWAFLCFWNGGLRSASQPRQGAAAH